MNFQTKLAIAVFVIMSVAAGFAEYVVYFVWNWTDPRGTAERIAIVGLYAFACSVLSLGALRYKADQRLLDQGEIRSAIAIGLTVTYLILVPLSLIPKPETLFDFTGDFVKNFGTVYATVIAFYFSTVAVEKGIEKWKKPSDTNPPPSDTNPPPKKIEKTTQSSRNQ